MSAANWQERRAPAHRGAADATAERPQASATQNYERAGELTLTSIVLFTLGAYGIAAGAASGEQTVVAVGVFAFVLFVAGIIWPIVALSGVGVAVWGPSDGVVGEIHDLHIEVLGRATRVELRVLDPPGEWWVTASPASGVIPRLASRRGVFHRVRVELRTSAPLGVFVRTRVVRVDLPNELAGRAAPVGGGAVALRASRRRRALRRGAVGTALG